MLYYLLCLVHIVICVGLVFFVLIQSNKGMGLSGAFGSVGAGDSLFGASGGMNVLIKITIGLSLAFAVTSIALTTVRPPSAQNSLLLNQADAVGGTVSDVVQQANSNKADATLPAAGGEASQEAAPAQDQADQAAQQPAGDQPQQ
ncbi:MAG: preprotein translocase subunit SecG [bacterium]|nr:preprotein translocase subunit SecG [bacterium]